ncbi:MAG: hypothetical protein H6581_05460 [Bacteroidia bacterium]|nr:hypothetical protein [Bacteroidia bacterium]
MKPKGTGKTANNPTTAFIFDKNQSDFSEFSSNFQILKYRIPWMKGNKEAQHALMHNWAKGNISSPYYLHSPKKELYILLPNDSVNTLINCEGTPLFAEKLKPWNVYSDILIKLVLAEYFSKSPSFISSEKFFLFAKAEKGQKYALVYCIRLAKKRSENFSDEFIVQGFATRFKKVTLEEYLTYYSRKQVPYGIEFHRNKQVFLRQLKVSEISQHKGGIFLHLPPKWEKSSMSFHSVDSLNKFNLSRGALLQSFIDSFISHLKAHGISASQRKAKLIQVSSSYQTATINLKGFKVGLIDARFNPSFPLNEMVTLPENLIKNVSLVPKTLDRFEKDLPLLFAMDYGKNAFEEGGILAGKSDPYFTLKSNPDFSKIPTQGLKIEDLDRRQNGNQFESKTFKNLKRNIEISVNQLALKAAILGFNFETSRLPHVELLKEKVYVQKEWAFYLKNGKLVIQQTQSRAKLVQLLTEISNISHPEMLLNDIYENENPFKLEFDSEFFAPKNPTIFHRGQCIQIIETQEKVLYEENIIKERLAKREAKIPKAKFLSSKNDHVSLQMNQFIKNFFPQEFLSYEEILSAIGKNLPETILKRNNDTYLRKYLKDCCGIDLMGKREGGIFGIFQGIWFEEENQQYFVGRQQGRKPTQENTFQLRKIHQLRGEFSPDQFFPLLMVDFIRHNEWTVLPYPFRLIQMKMELKEQAIKNNIYEHEK